MGMELHGLSPKNHNGKIYRSSIWIWHPMWNYIEINHPHLVKKLNGHSNSGEILEEEKSQQLSQIIFDDLGNNKITEYLKEYDDFMNSLPEVTCEYCLGYGFERQNILFQSSEVCFRCRGTGRSKMFITNYKAYTHDFYMLAIFCSNSGGFKIL
jgi:hypothetical protein